MNCCAICGGGPCPTVRRPLGKNDGMVPVCLECDSEPPRAMFGPERSYDTGGGFPTPQEMDRGAARVMGEEAMRAANEKARRDGQRPSARKPKALVDYMQFRAEGMRRARIHSDHRSHRSSRTKKLY